MGPNVPETVSYKRDADRERETERQKETVRATKGDRGDERREQDKHMG